MIRSTLISNRFLRKHRKWPIPPHNTQWQIAFNQNQALEALKLTQYNPTHLLSALIDSFKAYNCEPTPEAYHFVLKTLSNTSQFNHIPLVLHRIQFVEKFETPEYVFAQLITSYGSADKIEDSIELFSAIPKFRCVPSAYSLNSLLSVLCRKNEGLIFVPQLLLKGLSMKIRFEESTFRILVGALCRIGKVVYAVEILNLMINDGYDLDFKICSSILSSLNEVKGSDLAGFEILGFLESMKKMGFYPRMMDYSNVIRFLVKERRGLDALDVLVEMKESGIKPDIVCYTMVLHGIILVGEYERADELFDEMLVLGLVPDVYTYNVYINGLCNQNKVEAGINMISRMEELHCKPNSITYNVILKALSKNGELTRSKELMTEMNVTGVEANLQTYRILLGSLLDKGEIMEACLWMEEILEKYCCRQFSTYDEIIYALCQRGFVPRAIQLLEKMVGKKVAPGAKAWEALLYNYAYEPGLVNAMNTCSVRLLEQ